MNDMTHWLELALGGLTLVAILFVAVLLVAGAI
jgi:hypothetical protein